MKRTMIFLPSEMHQGLKRLAVERDRSVAELIREAVVRAYKEDFDDLAYARKFLARYRAGRGADYESYRASRNRRA